MKLEKSAKEKLKYLENEAVIEIKNKISNFSGINKEILSIKGKSNEGIGFIGRKEGIAVFSNTTIKIIDD